MEYSAPARSGDMASDMGTKQIRIRNQLRSCNEHVVPDGFGQRVANLAVYPRSLQCTPGSSAIESWTSGEERVSFYPRGCEHIKGVLLYFPDVVERAKFFLAKENVPDHRVTLLKGDILDGIPKSKEGDTITAKNFLLIFTEDGMVKVLENCRQVLAAHGKFIIVNSCNPEARDTEHNANKTGLHLGFRGIHIMAMSRMGHFSTKSEWLNLIDRLCKKKAFRLNAVYQTSDSPTLFELVNCEYMILFLCCVFKVALFKSRLWI